MRYVVMLCAVLCVAACGDKDKTDTQAAPAQAPAVQAKPQALPPPPAAPKTAAEMLAVFKYDIEVCKSVVVTFNQDKKFLDDFGTADLRQSKPLEDFLRGAAFAKSPDVQYLLANLKYFDIDASFEPSELAVAYGGGDVPIYCAVTVARLDDMEALGESAEGWEVRQYFLERWLKELRLPDGESFSEAQYEPFFDFVRKGAKLYVNHRAQYQAWAKGAVAYVEAQRADMQKSAPEGAPLDEWNKNVDDEIAFLKTIAQPGAPGEATAKAAEPKGAASQVSAAR